MALRRSTLALLLAALIGLLADCGGGSTVNVHNQPPPPSTSSVSIAFQPAPPTSVPINSTTSLTAVVSNDSSNAGVDWSLSCQTPGSCGTLSATHTASSQPVTFTPPPAFSGNSASFSIVAFATADHAENVVAPISVGAFGNGLKGTFVFHILGVDSLFEPYQLAGVVVLDGNGGITSGEQTANFYNATAGFSLAKSDAITGGSYFLGADGRGTAILNTADQDVGTDGVESFSLVYLSGSQALLAQTDGTESGTGSLDLQTGTAAPTGGYAFVVNGFDFASASPVAIGGVFNIDSPNTISGRGSVADQNLAGTVTAGQALTGSIAAAPDALGAITLTLNIPGFPAVFAPQFTGYIVDATHIQLVESDNTSGAGAATGGIAISQGSAAGTFTDSTAFSGTYVFDILGEDLTVFVPNTETTVGVLTADGAGNLTNGFLDEYLQQNSIQGAISGTGLVGAQISAQFLGTYTVDSKGTGRVHVSPSHFSPAPRPGIVPSWFFYLTGNGNPPLVLDGGDKTPALNYPSLGTGIAYVQAASGLTFSGEYGLNFTQQNGGENDGSGQMTATTSSGVLTGVMDLNSNFNRALNNPFTDQFGHPDSNGRFQSTLLNSSFTVEGYIIDKDHGFFVENDIITEGNSQVALGYYARRTPVCQGCP